jgi:beta-lactamase regulating signal transducer with metallopeptidase domain
MSLLLIETAFKASCVLAAAMMANALLRRRQSAASRHLVWTLAVAGLLVLPVLSASLPRWNVEIPVAGSAAAAPGHAPGEVDASHLNPESAVGAGVDSPAATTAAEVSVSAPISSRVGWLALLPVVYAAGVLLLLIRLLRERWMVRRLARRAADVSDPEWTRLLFDCARQIGVHRPVRLLRSLERSMPMAFGIVRPSILIPSVADTWNEDRRRAVLLHELAHIARRDCLTQLMAATACAVYWIHPGVWWIARRLRVERELACDDRVLRAGAQAREYAEHLLELAYTLGGYRAPALVVAMARPRQVEGRMLAVLDAARNRAVPAFRGRLAGAAIAAALLVPLAAAQAIVVPAMASSGGNGRTPGAGEVQELADAAAISEKGLAGTWEIRTTQTAPVVYLRLSESASSSHGSTVPVERLEGLARERLSGAGGAATFGIRRDAGAFAFEGMFKSGLGAGTYTFTPRASFPAEMAKRGFARPTPAEQYLLARSDIGFGFLDELIAQRYAKPDLSQLVRAAHHGVDLGFVREMGGLGYRLGQIDALIAQRDHGVSPSFIRELGAQGLKSLTADDLVRARDRGISPEYVRDLRQLGYQLTLAELAAAREHGVSAEYVRDLRQLGYQLSLAELTAAREHGVSAEYVRDLAALGYQRVPLDGLIAARGHGISPEYIRELRGVGYRLTLDELTRARDRGISADYVRQLNAQGRAGLTLDDLVSMRMGGPQARIYELRPGGLKFYAVYHMRAIDKWVREFADRWLR